MALSEDDKKRIEEEEYRKHVQSQLRNTQRLDLNHRIESVIESVIESMEAGREICRGFRNMIATLRTALDWALMICAVCGGVVILIVEPSVEGIIFGIIFWIFTSCALFLWIKEKKGNAK